MFKLSELGIPVIEAPMAGGINNPRLAMVNIKVYGLGKTILRPEYSVPRFSC